MASLPFVAATASATTLKLNPESIKHSSSSSSASASPTSLSTQKSPSILHQRNSSILQLNGSLESRNLDPQECVDYNYIPILEQCIDHNSVSEARIVHAHIIKTGWHDDLYTMTSLVNVYAKCGCLEDADRVFNRLPTTSRDAWTAMVAAYVHNSQPVLAIQTFLEMLKSGLYPTNYTLGLVLNACTSLRFHKLSKQIHAYIVKYQMDCENSIGNALCTVYSRCGMLDSAIKAFGRIKEKNVISWTAAISACGENSDAGKGLRMFSKMVSEEIEPNDFTFTCVLSLCNTVFCLSLGAQVHSMAIKLGYEARLPIKNSIMYLYLKCGLIDEAKKLFDETEATMVTWNAMIAGYAQLMNRASDDLLRYLSGAEALHFFKKLNLSSLKPDMYSLSSVLTVCTNLVALEQGEQIHALTIKAGFLSDVVLGTALVNMYGKCGSTERAATAFVEMSGRTLITWTSMITTFANHGRSQHALQLFEDMKLAGVRPNQITFVGVLSACAHAGMVNEALGYFNMMQKVHRMRPVMDHFACLVYMYVRLGQLDEAFDVVKKMNFTPSEHIWSMLIAGCKIHGNLELGCSAADKLIELKPREAESYVLLLNMYQSAGRLEDVSRTRELMRDEKIREIKDWSLMSIRGSVHLFKPDYHSDADMNKLLDDLHIKAKTLGYEPVESAEETVHQTEKLAVAFGMLKTRLEGTPTPLRVLKSSSMSRDSHSFLEYVSKLETHRKIVVRDSRRLHTFVNGNCPCGGFSPLL